MTAQSKAAAVGGWGWKETNLGRGGGGGGTRYKRYLGLGDILNGGTECLGEVAVSRFLAWCKKVGVPGWLSRSSIYLWLRS